MARSEFKVLGAVLLLWLLWAFQPLIKEKLGFDWDNATSGQWGDTFAALNALFAALGFAAVFQTLRLQQQQIKNAQDEQNRQRFESSYFELLGMLREIRNDAQFSCSKDVTVDHPAWSGLKTGGNAFKFSCAEFIVRSKKGGVKSTKEVAYVYEKNIHNRYESRFGPYFRMLYTILYRIKMDNVLTQGDKNRYGNLLRSQMNSYELALAGLNGLSSVSKDLRILLTDFRMLKYLPNSLRKILEKHYEEQAFMARD